MTEEDKLKVLRNSNTDDFNTMRAMLSEIEIKTLQVDPTRLREWYAPIRSMIFEAWNDACNPTDSFLYK